MEITYYDIGVNLFCKQYPHPDIIIKQAEQEHVACILTGTSMAVNTKVDLFVKGNPQVYGTVGIHPHNADSAQKENFDMLEKMLTENKNLVAVGECGLDYDRMFSSKENQIRCLEKHIILAKKLDKPLFLHERLATDDFIKRFKNHSDICKKSVVHCFTGDKKTLERYLKLGFYIGITGWICDDKRGKELRDAVKIIPLERILVETDAPYLAPKNVAGLSKVNVPANIKYVTRELAKYMNIDETTLIRFAKENTKRIFKLKS
jgi:TatD DNase family protein